MKQKLTSRKFWLTVAIILGGIASTISGACTDNKTLMIVGMVCGGLAAIIYEICETVIDTAAVSESETITVEETETDDTEGTVG